MCERCSERELNGVTCEDYVVLLGKNPRNKQPAWASLTMNDRFMRAGWLWLGDHQNRSQVPQIKQAGIHNQENFSPGKTVSAPEHHPSLCFLDSDAEFAVPGSPMLFSLSVTHERNGKVVLSGGIIDEINGA